LVQRFNSAFSNLMILQRHGILILGVEGSGKTSLLETLKTTYGGVQGLPPEKIVSTVGCNVARLVLRRSRALVWDLGGRASLRSIWEKYYADCKALVFCVDSADVVHWDESREVLKELLLDTRLSGVPILVFASKSDVVGSKHRDDMVQFFNLKEMGDTTVRRVHFVSASFLDNRGVSEGMEWIEKKLLDESMDY
jgi:ADP-ribosylation factor related protein 1